MNLYHKIDHKIRTQGIDTITLDIFDTILLRKIWPENLQFYKVARVWLPIFNGCFSKDITTDEIYSVRLYSRNELIHINREYNYTEAEKFSLESEKEYDVNLDNWFMEIINYFASKYSKNLNEKQKQMLLKQMIDIELSTEKENLIPNTELINTLLQLKRKHKKLKIFYLSDMYLRTPDITHLFDHFGIHIFDGGITSTEAEYTKATGNLYNYIHATKKLYKGFNLSRNLHIGDNKTSDYMNALISGSDAVLYHKIRFRRVRTLLGQAKIWYIHRQIEAHDKRILQSSTQEPDSPANIWHYFGELFSQPLFTFLKHLTLAAKYAPETTFLMVSSEATVFDKYAKLLDASFSDLNNVIIAEKLNRKCIIRAILWALIQKDDFKYNLEVIFKTANLGELDGSRREFYQFIFGENYPYSETTINYRSKKDFYSALLYEIKNASHASTKPLREAYKYVKSFLPKDESRRIVIVDVGWGGTVQVLFSQFANLHNYHTEIKGLYLGVMPGNRFEICDMPPMEGYLLPDVRYGKDRSLFCAVLWEYPYTNKPQFNGDLAHLEQIHIGIKDGLKTFHETNLAPKIYFDRVVRREIQRLVSKPRKSESRTIGSIRFDMGFAKPSCFQIVEMHYTRRQIYKQLLIHPKQTVHKVVFKRNHWAGGFISYYRIPFLRRLIKVYGYMVKKTLI